MLLHGKLDSTTVNGPGTRAALWFSGCTLSCSGCHNPDTHAFDLSKYVNNDQIKTWLLNLDGIEGVTFSGGEPMQHVGDLLDMIEFLREMRPELSVGIFTGYTQRELESGNFVALHNTKAALVQGDRRLWDEVSNLIDFAVMGRFNVQKMVTDKALCGSSNQDVVLFSDRYSEQDFQPQTTQVTISAEGLVQISGFPGTEFIKAVQIQ